jgi:hypothetical protein
MLFDRWINWIYGLTNVEVALSFILPLLLFGCGGLALFKRYFEHRLSLGLESNEALNFFAQCVGVAYGILIGLTAVACWDNFEEVEKIISEEVSAVGDFHRLTYAAHGASAERMRVLSLQYLEAVIQEDWPSANRGETIQGSLKPFHQIREILYAMNPVGGKEERIFAELVESFRSLTLVRQERINRSVEDAVPGVFWGVLLAGGLITTFMIFFVHMPSMVVRYILMVSYCLIMGSLYFLIAVIDHPFRGGVHVSAEPYQHLLVEIKAHR